MNKEVEIKFAIADIGAIREKIKNIGGIEKKEVFQKTIRLDISGVIWRKEEYFAC